MLRGVIQGISPFTHIQEGQRAAFGDPQGNLQIAKPDVAVHTQDRFSFLRQGFGDAGTDGGFSGSALPGHDRKKLPQSTSPPIAVIKYHYKGISHKTQEDFQGFSKIFHQNQQKFHLLLEEAGQQLLKWAVFRLCFEREKPKLWVPPVKNGKTERKRVARRENVRYNYSVKKRAYARYLEE